MSSNCNRYATEKRREKKKKKKKRQRHTEIWHGLLLLLRLLALQMQDSVDVMISHDWPKGVEKFGNTADLLRIKPYFRDEVHTERRERVSE